MKQTPKSGKNKDIAPLQVRQRNTNDPTLRRFLQSDPAAYLYFLGDLEEPYASQSQFYTGETATGDIRGVWLHFQDGDNAALLCGGENKAIFACLQQLSLPHRAIIHLPMEMLDAFQQRFRFDWLKPHMRMVRTNPQQTPKKEPHSGIRKLTSEDLPDIRKLYKQVPEIWFTQAQFEQNPFVGGFDSQGKLVAMGGTHIFVPESNIAAIGSVGVDPKARGRGWGAGIMQALLQHIEAPGRLIGLNVASANPVARRLYHSFGFTEKMEFLTGMATLR